MKIIRRINQNENGSGRLKAFLVLAVFSILVFAVVRAASKPKPVPTTQQVKDLLCSKGYDVRDLTDKYKIPGSSVTQNITVEQDTLLIQFFVFDDSNSAQKGYDKLTTEISKHRTLTQDVETKGFHGNYIYRTLRTNGKYYFLSRIGNTLVYASGTADDREAVNAIMFELGYLE